MATEYELRVASLNKVGAGEYSSNSSFQVRLSVMIICLQKARWNTQFQSDSIDTLRSCSYQHADGRIVRRR